MADCSRRMNYNETARKSVEAWFQDLDNKIKYLKKLRAEERLTEAWILCVCYIDWLSCCLYGNQRDNYRYFVKALTEHGSEELLTYIHGEYFCRQLVGLARSKNNEWEKQALDRIVKFIEEEKEKVSTRIREQGNSINNINCSADSSDGDNVSVELFRRDELVDLAGKTSNIGANEIKTLETELWRGTLAAIVYKKIRIPSVHGIGSGQVLSFGGSTFEGRPVSDIDFTMICNCLENIASFARAEPERVWNNLIN